MTSSDAMRNQAHELDALNNGSTTDTRQWCELHLGHCNDIVPVRRVFESLNAGPKRKTETEIFFACQNCIRDLKKAELITNSKYAGLPCVEIAVPRGLGKGRGLEFPVRQQRIEPLPLPTISPLRSGQIAYEVTLDALQVKYLRALGLRVIPA